MKSHPNRLLPTESFEPIDEQFVQRTLIPYSEKGTVYLKQASTNFKVTDRVDQRVESDTEYKLKGEFSITESCYIKSTGHFNAVEFNICYNQLFYVAIAHACSLKLLNCVQHMTLDEFYLKQLSHIYIVRLESYYKKIIDPRSFWGVMNIKKTKSLKNLTLFKTGIAFWDSDDGLSYGEVDVVIDEET